MLVIRRRPGETLVIGDQIEIEILDATASQVKLGIRAPKCVTVLRKEIQVTRDQNRAAAQETSAPELDRLKKALLTPISGL
ncbi:MAG TPA: carbon storage regulator [Bryobacteraceae bacterium]|jgi:carbon storage regulator